MSKAYIVAFGNLYEVDGYTIEPDGYVRTDTYRAVGDPTWHANGGFGSDAQVIDEYDEPTALCSACGSDEACSDCAWDGPSETAIPEHPIAVVRDSLTAIASDRGLTSFERIDAAKALADFEARLLGV